MSKPKIRPPDRAIYRFSVLSAVSSMSFLLMSMGFPVAEAMAIALITAAGAVEVACWLTAPEPAFKVRIKILVLILVVVVRLLALGQPVVAVLLVVIGGSGCAVWIARRLTDRAYRLPEARVAV